MKAFKFLLLVFGLAFLCACSNLRAREAQEVNFVLAENLIILPVTIGEESLNFILDTGAGNTVLSDQAAVKLGLDLSSLATAEGASATTSFKVYMTSLLDIQIGTLKVPSLKVAIMPMQFIGQKIKQEVDGILGKNFLEKYVTSIDYQHTRITFTPASL